MKKRILSLLLTLIMVVGMLPTEALAAESGTGEEETLPFSYKLAGDSATSTGKADYIVHYFGPDKNGDGKEASMSHSEMSPGWDGYYHPEGYGEKPYIPFITTASTTAWKTV